MGSWADGPSRPSEEIPHTPRIGLGRHPAHILMVDPNPSVRNRLSRLLGHRWTVEAVGDGRAALDAAREQPPDILLLTNATIPGLDSSELLKAIRTDCRAGLRVILLLADPGDEPRVEGLEDSADDCLERPFSDRELLAHVAAHVEL